MSSIQLLSEQELPNGFQYPSEFLRIIDQSLIDLNPWIIYSGEPLQIRNNGLKNRYPNRTLIPFAGRLDNDDIACWDMKVAGKIFLLHDFASPGYEQRAIYNTFWDWC